MFLTGPPFCLRKFTPNKRAALRSVKVKAVLLRREQLAEFIQLETRSLGISNTSPRPNADSILW